MATVEVSTWAELVSAVTTAADSSAWSSTTVKLTADIDLNDTDPSGVCCQVLFASDAIKYVTGALTIDGGYTDSVTGEEKRHVIKNARTDITNPRPIFYLTDNLVYERWGKHIKFKNLDFQNLILAGQPFVWIRTDNIQVEIASRTPWQVDLDNCRFVGSRTAAYLFFSNAYLNCNRCYFDMPFMAAGGTDLAGTSLIPKDDSNATSAVATYCRFKETYGDWVYDSNGYGSSPTLRVFSFSYFKCSGCRMEGSMTIPVWQCSGYPDYNGWGFFCAFTSRPNASYTPATQNVFDVSLTCDDSHLVQGYFNKKVTYSGFSYLVKGDAKTKIGDEACEYVTTGASAIDGATYPYPVVATPAQMKDPSYLNSQGFDIVVPAT